MQTTCSNLKSLAARYIEAVGLKEYAAVEAILSPRVSFNGPFMKIDSAPAFIAGLKRMAPIWEGNEVRTVLGDAEQVCVFYNFVTNTQAGAVPCIELLTFEDGRIAKVELFFDRAQFAPAQEALARRAEP